MVTYICTYVYSEIAAHSVISIVCEYEWREVVEAVRECIWGGWLRAPSPSSAALSLSIAPAASCLLVATHHSPILASRTMNVELQTTENVEKPGGRQAGREGGNLWVLNGYSFPLPHFSKDLKQAISHFLHGFWSSNGYLVRYQSEDSCAHQYYVLTRVNRVSWRQQESPLTRYVHLFPNFTILIRNGFFVLLIVASLDVMYCSFAHSLYCEQNKNSYQDGNSPTALSYLLVLLRAC